MIPAIVFARGGLLIMAVLLTLAATPARAEDDALETRRAQFRSALEAAERGTDADFRRQRAALADHPLAVWLDYAHLRRRIDEAEASQVEAFMARHHGQPAAALLREAWLNALLKRRDWVLFERHYVPSTRLEMRCGHALARLRTGNLDEDWFADVQALWRNGQSLPNDCDLPFAEFQARGRLTDALRWERIELAAQTGQPGLMRFLARALPTSDRQLAERYAAFVDAPTPDVNAWPKDARSRRIAVLGLTRLAGRNPDAAEALLALVERPLALGEGELGSIRYQIALWSAASYLPDSARRLAAVPAGFYDDRLHRWRLREALARGDDSAALAAIAAVDPAERNDGSRWRYFEARLRERAGQADLARELYTAAARHADFHGFMAADRVDLPYALCPLRPDSDPELRARMASHPALVRAIELFRLDRPGWAEREWRALVASLSDAERIEAVRRARAANWHDRALFGLGEQPEELRYYRLRFPLPLARTVRSQADRNRIDPAWLAAQIRAESAWMRQARSPADARGLMQLLPATGRATARTLGLPWPGAQALYRPVFNITLGSAYLRQQLDDFGGQPHLAIAAYNAGPTPVDRWRAQRPGLDVDFFIETIPFHETRDYVARVLAFSVIYDWRLHGRAVPLSDRLAGAATGSPTRAIVCPAPATTATP